jgi:O-antigen/teichoic acid export membrane protein
LIKSVFSNKKSKLESGIKSNLVANYAGRVWGIASVYLFVPLYIKYLGLDAYGVIAFHSVLLGILFIADAGLSSAFAREVARSPHKQSELATLLRSLEVVYIAIFVVILSVIGLASGWIASSWLNASQELSAPILQASVILMGASIATQVAMSLYNGALMGAEQHDIANGFLIGFSIVRSGLVIIPLHFSPNLLVYFGWQLVTVVFFLLWMRRTVWRKLGFRLSARFSAKALRNISGFAFGMLGVAVISALNTQIDKLVLSKMLSLQDLARYTLAGLLAQAPSIITLPIAVSLLPRLTRWVSEGQHELLIAAYHRFSYVIASIAATSGLVVALNSAQLISWWTGDSSLSTGLDLVVLILVSGHVLLALQYMPYHLALAHGHSRTNVIIGAAFLVATPFLLVALIRQIGIAGAAIPWLLMNACAAILLATLLTRRFISGQLRQWWLTGFGIPLVITSVCAGFTQWFWSAIGLNPEAWIWKIVALVATCALFCFVAYLLLFSRVRTAEAHLHQR